MVKRTILAALMMTPLIAFTSVAPAEARLLIDRYGDVYHNVPRGPGYWTRDRYGRAYFKPAPRRYGGWRPHHRYYDGY